MKKYLLSLIFIGIAIISWAQQTSIEWISPTPIRGEYHVHNDDKLTIKLNITNLPKGTQPYIKVNNKYPPNYAKSNVVPLSKGYFETQVDIPPNSAQSIVLVLKDRQGKIHHSSEPLFVSRGNIPKPDLYVLAFGPQPGGLQHSDNDAIDFDWAFSRQACGDSALYGKVIGKHFVDEEADAWKILAEINTVIALNTIKPNDVFILFMSSHGYRKNDEFYIQGDNYTLAASQKTSVSSSELFEKFDPIHAKKIFFIDACKSGEMPEDSLNFKTNKNQLTGYTIITSSDFNSNSYEHEKWENGAFTEIMLNGLQGAADQENEAKEADEIITVYELFKHLKTGIPRLCKNTIKNYEKKEQQYPQKIMDELGNIPLFRYDKFCNSFAVFHETIKLPTGTVTIGSIKGEIGDNADETQHDFDINKLTYMGKYEVTNAEYCEFLNDNKNRRSSYPNWIKINSRHCKIHKKKDKYRPKNGYQDMPVVMVSWRGAVEFADWLSEKDCIYDYRLPTPDEWEYAARGGPRKPYQIYAGTNNYKDFNYRKKLTKVGMDKPNSLGIYNMSTNVSEWCDDEYKEEKSRREVRGGNFKSTFKSARTAKRQYLFADERKPNIGFRLLRTSEKGTECE